MSGLPVGTRRVIVTGGGTGIGRAVAEALLAAGGSVMVVGRREQPLRELEQAIPFVADVTDAEQRERMWSHARQTLGGIDGLVHSAGLSIHQPFGHIDEASLRAQLEVNLVAPLRLGERALTELETGGGVVFISSTLAHRPVPTSAVYSAAKSGLLSASRALALAGAARRIRVNAVSPGLVDTDMVRAPRLAPGEPMPIGAEREERLTLQLASLSALHPLGRMGSPEEIAAAVVHLLAATWTTGAELVVDGGLLLRE